MFAHVNLLLTTLIPVLVTSLIIRELGTVTYDLYPIKIKREQIPYVLKVTVPCIKRSQYEVLDKVQNQAIGHVGTTLTNIGKLLLQPTVHPGHDLANKTGYKVLLLQDILNVTMKSLDQTSILGKSVINKYRDLMRTQKSIPGLDWGDDCMKKDAENKHLNNMISDDPRPHLDNIIEDDLHVRKRRDTSNHYYQAEVTQYNMPAYHGPNPMMVRRHMGSSRHQVSVLGNTSLPHKEHVMLKDGLLSNRRDSESSTDSTTSRYQHVIPPYWYNYHDQKVNQPNLSVKQTTPVPMLTDTELDKLFDTPMMDSPSQYDQSPSRYYQICMTLDPPTHYQCRMYPTINDLLTAQKGISQIIGKYPVATVRGRTKRAIANWWGDLGKWWAGYLTEDDLESLTSEMRLLSNQNELNKRMWKTTSDQVVMLSKHVDSEFSAIHGTMVQLSRNLAHNIQELKTFSSRIEHDLNELSKFQDTLALLTAQLSRIQHIHIVWDLLSSKIDEITKFYDAIVNALVTRTPNAIMLKPETIQRLFATAGTSLSSNVQLPVVENILQWYYTGGATVFTFENQLWVGGNLPMIPKDNIRSVIGIKTLPISLGNNWAQFIYNDHVLVEMERGGVWALLTQREYLECKSSAYSACDIQPVWRQGGINRCVEGIFSGKQSEVQHCELQHIKDPPLFRSHALPIYPTSWFISTHPSVNSVRKLCKDKDDIVSVTIENITRTAVIDTLNQCAVEVDDLQLYPPYPKNSATITVDQDHNTHFNLSDVEMLQVSRSDTEAFKFIGNTPLFTHNFSVINDRVLFKNDRVSLKDFIDSAIHNQSEYLTQSDKISDEIEYVRAHRALNEVMSSNWLSSLSSGLTPTHIIMFGINALLLVLSVLLWVKLRSLEGLVIGGSSMIPGSYAFKILSPLNNTYKPITPQIIAHANSTLQVCNAQANTSSSMWVHMALMGLMMLVIMATFHYVSEKKHNETMYFVQRSLGSFPQNKNAQHNLGETSVIVFFIISIRKLCSSTTQNVEVGVQIATIPDHPGKWDLVLKNGIMDLIQSARATRMSSRWRANLHWGNVCIKHVKYSEMDTCHDMPKTCVIHLSELTGQVVNGPSYLWTSCQFVAVTKVYFKYHSSVKEAYSYIKH